jgi:oligopeptide transport system ATP-binding protein
MPDAAPMTDAATREAALKDAPVVLSVRDLEVQFRTEDGWLTAIDGLSYDLRRGETLGIVGESGSGKSVTNLAVMRLLPIPPARILFHGQDLLELSAEAMRKIRGNKISMIFQDPMSSLNPFLRISKQLAEVLDIHQGLTGADAKARVIDMLARVGIPDAERRYDHYPHQFSGGMRQRVMIAMMLLNTPELLIADEPTTALDVTIQAQILDLLGDLQRQFEMAITLITHDLGVVAGMSDRVIVMYSGKVMEQASATALFAEPSHPYTLGLLRSLPRLDQAGTGSLYSIPGRPPDLNNRPSGCPFAPRCQFVRDVCRSKMPETTEVAPGHTVACFATDEVRELVATGRHLEVSR